MTETRRLSERLMKSVLLLMIRELLTGYEPHSYPIIKLKGTLESFP